MRERPDIDESSAIWAVADAVLTGYADDWDAASTGASPSLQPLLRELRSIAQVVAVHEERQRTVGSTVSQMTTTGDGDHGETWGPLVILEKIGGGAFGEVFRAREPRLDRQVAVKFFRPQRLGATPPSTDVVREGCLLARVRHPNVVTVYGAKHLDARIGIWMEYIDGFTLEEIVVERGPLEVKEVVTVGRDLCGALAALHQAEILHRDIKARNVMREKTGRVVLMDLGAGCEVIGMVPVRQYGTPLYAAPEVLLDGLSSCRGDIYSLGVLLYFLASGRYPVSGDTLADISAAHANGEAVPLASAQPDLPPAFLRIVAKALASDPDGRFTTAAEMGRELDKLLRTPELAGRGATGRGDREAQEHYLMGEYFWGQRGKGGFPKALECYRQAVARDPEFAAAYLGIARCLCFITYWQFVCPRDGYEGARSAAERALALDPGLGVGHAALGCVHAFHDWDAVAAERAFERAVELDPEDLFCRGWYALFLATESRHEEANAVVPKRTELNPASLVVAADAITLAIAGRLDEALGIFRMGLRGDPDSLLHHNHMALGYLLAQEWNDAEASLRLALAVTRGEDPWTMGFLGLLLAHLGRGEEARELIARTDEIALRRYVSCFCRMIPWIGLRRNDMWEPLLEKAIEERDTYLVWMRSLGDRLPGLMVPRFVEMLDGAGLLEWPLGAG